jgi:hypothetical protein
VEREREVDLVREVRGTTTTVEGMALHDGAIIECVMPQGELVLIDERRDLI